MQKNSAYYELISSLLHDDASVASYFDAYDKPLQKSIHIVNDRISYNDFLMTSEKYGRSLEDPLFTTPPTTHYITRQDDMQGLGKHRLHSAGFFYIQEVAASLPAAFLDIHENDIVLDMCAAPGGKSTQIAETLRMTGNKPGLIISNEISNSRIVALQHNLNRTASYNSAVTSVAGEKRGDMTPGLFNAVLVDAPCSGEGTGFKSDAGTKWRNIDHIQKLAHIQKSLLLSAIKACKVGGTVIYSTCTINPRENEDVVQYALEKHGDSIELQEVHLKKKSPGIDSRDGKQYIDPNIAKLCVRLWPHLHETGGFFIAKFHKIAETQSHKTTTNKKQQSQLQLSQTLQDIVKGRLLDTYGIITDDEKHFFVGTSKQIYLTSPRYKDIHNIIDVEKVGIPIFKYHNEKEASPLHGLGSCLGSLATKNYITLPEEKIQHYSEGYDLDLSQISYDPQINKEKYRILKRHDKGISVGKIVGTTLKNKFSG